MDNRKNIGNLFRVETAAWGGGNATENKKKELQMINNNTSGTGRTSGSNTQSTTQYGSGTPGNQGTQSSVGAQPGGGGAGLGGQTSSGSGNYIRGYDEKYWSQNYANEPYYDRQYSYDDYAPAYRLGSEARSGRYSGQSWDQAQSGLEKDWESYRGNSRLSWNSAQLAARAAWNRSDRSMDGGAGS
jgi:hypothetical protein